MAWNDGLEYLRVPKWRPAFEQADVIYGVDVKTGREVLVFGGDHLRNRAVRDRLQVLRISIDGAGERWAYPARVPWR
jgi:hypothetical protein